MKQFNEVIDSTRSFIDKEVDNNLIPSLMDFVRIPNLSPQFDSEWKTNKLDQKAANHLVDWVKQQKLVNCNAQVVQDEGKPPVVFVDIQATNDKIRNQVLFYGHFDKQPHFVGWEQGTGPITPVIKDNWLYGRGAADDGYALYAAILSVKSCQQMNIPHPRCVLIIEGEEESGSQSYMPYFVKLSQIHQIQPNLIICLDSRCATYDTLWLNCSMRGCLKADISVKVLQEGVHSGDSSGIVPSSFRILRILLDRLENSKTGIINSKFQVIIPPKRYSQLYEVAQKLGKSLISHYPILDEMDTVDTDPFLALLNRNWKAQAAYIGIEGLPQTEIAGNVLRTSTTVRLSLRLPPTLNGKQAGEDLKKLIESDPPYGAQVKCNIISADNGFHANELSQQLETTMEAASKAFFGNNMMAWGSGGSVPELVQLQEKLPESQIIAIGVLGPHSNAHGPNEKLNIPYLKKLICCVSQIVAESSNFKL